MTGPGEGSPGFGGEPQGTSMREDVTLLREIGMPATPLWIFNNLFRPQQAPIVNVVAAALVVLSVLPLYLAQRLSEDAVRSGV